MPAPRRRKTSAKPPVTTGLNPADDADVKATSKTQKPSCPHQITDDELLDDGTLLCQFTIPGRPATKKTHQNVVFVKGHPRILPSSQYCAYEKLCKSFCQDAWVNDGKQPIDFGVSVCMKVWLNTWVVGDATGYQQAIGDILEKWGVIADDAWLHWTDADGTHWFGGVDKDNPRVEITIRRLRHPKEAYRADKESQEARKLARKSSAKGADH